MVKPKKTTRQLKPKAQTKEPQAQRVFHTLRQMGGVRVNEDTALTYSAVWSCVRFIAESLAELPLRHHRKLPAGGSEIVEASNVDWILHTQPNPETPAFNWREIMFAHALTWGNGYSEIERDMAGRPVWAWQITPDRVRVERMQNGQLVYDVANPRQTNTVLLPDDVIHLRGMGFDGIVGYSVIQYAAKSIGSAIASDESAATYFGNDSTPGGLLKHPRRLSEGARKDLLENWQMRHGGSKNKRVVALLEEGLEWVQTSLPPQDSQLIENRQYGPVDICRWFRVPPHKVGILDRATFSNIEQQEIQSVIDCLLPWAVRFEQELNIKLFGRINRGTQYVKHNFTGRLRGDAQMRASFYQIMLDRGVFCINDVLDKEDMNPIGPDGDKRFVQRNMITLDQAGMPEMAPATNPPADNPTDNTDEETDDEANTEDTPPDEALAPVLYDTIGRILRREQRAALDQRGKPVNEWFVDFAVKQLKYAQDALTPVVSAMLNVMKSKRDAGVVASAFVAQYKKDLELRCQSDYWSGEGGLNLEATYTDLLSRIALAIEGSL